MEAELSPQEMQLLLAEARKLIAAEPPEAGSPDLDRRLAQIQSGQFEPSDQHRADGLMPVPTMSMIQPHHYQTSVMPKRPEMSKTDYFGAIAAIGVIGLFAIAGLGIIASLVVMAGKSAEGASYRATIEQLVADNQKLSSQAIKAAEDGKPRCYGLIVTSCGEQAEPSYQPVAQPKEMQVQAVEAPAQIALICDANAMATATPVNVRSGGGVEFAIVAQVPCGGAVEVLRYEPDGWSKVAAGAATGYMKTSFLGG
ncbi:MAG: SH3 domain-containing protein [Timaviella obliquedivisa GSE-PSE-MK23-08B]|jgi:hypothetical protein|nr:SH3 domain-containing protein [Timaviella obliquedivisa GSE-PSE-MK23-08B]